MDVLVTKSNNKFITSVYRKRTFTVQYGFWNSCGPKQCKTNLIDTLTHQALKIYSKSTLKHSLDNICSILVENGYSEFLIDLRISKKLLCFQEINQSRFYFFVRYTADNHIKMHTCG